MPQRLFQGPGHASEGQTSSHVHASLNRIYARMRGRGGGLGASQHIQREIQKKQAVADEDVVEWEAGGVLEMATGNSTLYGLPVPPPH